MKFITIGSDPEFFVLNPKGEPYPCMPFAKGTKDNPSPIEELGKGYFEQRDNLSLEGNIPPAQSKEEFIKNVTNLREYFSKKVTKYDYSLSPNGVEYFPKRMLNLPEANEFGCSTVISSWASNQTIGFREQQTPILFGLKFRVAGFHIHIGYDSYIDKIGKKATDILIGRLFDLFVTMPASHIKNEPERQNTYGKFGIIRSKPYGVECRTLSTFFTQKEYLGWVWDQIMKIEDFINQSNEEDLSLLIKQSQYLNYNHKVSDVFIEFFEKFKNGSYLNNFDEIKKIYEAKQLKIKFGDDTNPNTNSTSIYNIKVAG